MIVFPHEKIIWIDPSSFCPAAISLVALAIGDVDALRIVSLERALL